MPSEIIQDHEIGLSCGRRWRVFGCWSGGCRLVEEWRGC